MKGGESITTHEYIEYLINTYENLIFSICYKFTNNYIDAQDMAQETYLAAFRFLEKNKKTKVEKEKAWLSKIAVNKCLNYKSKPSLEVAYMNNEDKDNLVEQLESKERVKDIVLDMEYVDKYYEQYINHENDYVDGKVMFRNVDTIEVLVEDEEVKEIKGKDKDKIVKALKDYDWNKNIVREPKRGDHDIILDFGNNEAVLVISKESKNVYMHGEDVYGNELDNDTYELIMKAIK